MIFFWYQFDDNVRNIILLTACFMETSTGTESLLYKLHVGTLVWLI